MVVLPKFDNNSAPVLKLIDFGCACFLRRASYVEHSGAIEDMYSPPEVVSGSANAATFSGDIYRLGATLFTMLFKCPPSHGITHRDRINGKFCEPHRWNSLSAPCKDIINKLLSSTPERRPTCAQVLAHPWVVGENYSNAREPQKLTEMPRTTVQKRNTRTSSAN
jgi:serine/threonine protein kinase